MFTGALAVAAICAHHPCALDIMLLPQIFESPIFWVTCNNGEIELSLRRRKQVSPTYPVKSRKKSNPAGVIYIFNAIAQKFYRNEFTNAILAQITTQ